MPTYVWCNQCHKLYNKEMLHEECDPQVPVTPDSVKKEMGILDSADCADAHEPNQTTIDAMNER
jgi:hypothetical protein